MTLFQDINAPQPWARCRSVGCYNATVVNTRCREHWLPTEDGGGAASAKRKAGRPLQLQPNRPAQPASPGVQPRPGA